MTDDENKVEHDVNDVRADRIEWLANQALNSGRELTKHVVLIGRGWYYGATIKNHKLSQKNHAEIMTLTGQQTYQSPKTIDEVLQEFYPEQRSISVIPVGLNRINEARRLYEQYKISEKEEHSYGELMEVQLRNRFVSLYLLNQ